MKTKKAYLYSIFCILAFTLSEIKAQNNQIADSLYNLVATGKDSTKIKSLNELSRLFSETDTQKALEMAQKAYKKALTIRSDKFIAHSLNRIGSVYDYKSMPDSANDYYLQALKLFEKNNDKDGIATVYQNIGVLYYYQEDFDQAIANYKKALDIRLLTNDEKYISKLYNNMGASLRRQKKYDEAITYYQKAIELKLKQNDRQSIAASYQNIAVAYQCKKDFKKALDYLNKAIEINTQLKNDLDLGLNYTGLADLYESMGDFKKGIEYAKIAIEHAEKVDSPDLLYNSYELLWILDTLNNDYRSAVRNQYTSRKYKTKVFSTEKTNAINKLRIIYETEKKDHEIDLLNIENEAKNKQRLWMFSIIILITLLLLMALYFYLKKRKDNQLLIFQKQEIIDKTQQLQLQAEEIAKHRSQMNPHFIFNALNSLQGLILNNDNNKSITQINALSKLMRQTLNNSEHELISLEEEINYLKNYVDFELLRFDLKFDFIVEIDQKIDKENTGIPPMIIQPLIENCLKHAKLNTTPNAKIILKITNDDKKLMVSVEDNGCGRKDTETNYDSRATSIIKKRLQELNKKAGFEDTIGLKIVDLKNKNTIGIGTRCEFELPLVELY
ncbi:MAG: tetratricopeptide repeat protein [Bacteroidia bacterium]